MLIGSTLAIPVLQTLPAIPTPDLHRAMMAFQLLVAGTTAWSGLSYAFLPKAVTMLGSDERLKARQGVRGRAIIGVTFGCVVLGAAWIGIQVDTKRETALEPEVDASRGGNNDHKSGRT